ncbi:hypothetical protein [Methylobacterium oryzisoli]|uniref:hypothetical protein n=1 Tax=Methylobacterium oryzisoli TaxID=3385502 RepID=UPI00389162E9
MFTLNAIEPRMILVFAGAALMFGGVLFTAFKANWGAHFKVRQRTDSASGLSVRANWPGLVMLAAAVVCFLGAAAV